MGEGGDIWAGKFYDYLFAILGRVKFGEVGKIDVTPVAFKESAPQISPKKNRE